MEKSIKRSYHHLRFGVSTARCSFEAEAGLDDLGIGNAKA